MTFQSKRPTEGCFVEVFYVLGRKQGGCGRRGAGGSQRWCPGTLRSRRDPGVKQVPLGLEGAGMVGSVGGVGW